MVIKAYAAKLKPHDFFLSPISTITESYSNSLTSQ
jgi:hypothetical protein